MTTKTPRWGAHGSIADGFVEAARDAKENVGGNALQVFLKSPRSRGTCKLTDPEATAFRSFARAGSPLFLVVHSSYLINLAKPLPVDAWEFESLIEDLNNTEKLGGAGVVLHVGKTLALSYEMAERHLIENLKRVLERTESLSTHLILENTARQGSEMGYRLDQLERLQKAIAHPRLSFCLDTCHAFAAGYDLRTPEGVEAFFEEFDRRLGLNRLTVIHFNDSMFPTGSQRDRHDNLGFGYMGQEGLVAIARLALQHDIPLILETPEKTRTHRQDLDLLKAWMGRD